MTLNPEVLGLGQCALDILGTVPRYPEKDRKAELDEVLFQGGGPVATALVTLARLGVGTAILGRVGDDDFGGRIRRGLEEEGVDCAGLLIRPESTSQFAFIAVEPVGGARNIFWHPGTARDLSEAEVVNLFPSSCRVLHLDGLQMEASAAAARIARERGIVTVLDGGSVRDGTQELLPLIDHLVISEKFARQTAAGSDPVAALEKLMTFGAGAATVTLGENGSRTLTSDGEEFRQEAFSVEAVDTTGCGDVFHGGYIYGLLQGWPLRRTVRFAAACAAMKARAPGGRTGIPTLEEVEAFFLNPEKHFHRGGRRARGENL